jgi:hypothetical protein
MRQITFAVAEWRWTVDRPTLAAFGAPMLAGTISK